MGMFDDLIPQSPNGAGGMFDDLVLSDAAARKAREQPDLSRFDKAMARISLPNLRGSAPYRVMQGMADPVVGAVQLGANMLPNSTGIPQAVNARVKYVEGQYEGARAANGSTGFDPARMLGNVVSPVNALIAARVPLAATAGTRALQGMAVGGGTAAMEPVTDGNSGFLGKKAAQVAVGAAAGGVLTPALGAVGDAVVRRLQLESPTIIAARSSMQTDKAIAEALKDMGQTIHDIPPQQLQALRQQVLDSRKVGKELNPAAMLRKADFDALGIEPTLGQLTRDPMQFAREKNLRGVANVGEPLTARFSDQGRKLTDLISKPGQGAQDAYNAGTQLSQSLAGTDDVLGRHVSGLYRESQGKGGAIPLQGLAQDAADIMRRYEGVGPLKGIRNILEDVGVLGDGMRQQKVFGYDEAESLLKQVNKLRGVGTTLAAASELRSAVKKAITESGDDAFGAARKAASERFKLQDAVPALKAASEGSVAPDDFVRRFVINGKTDEVKGLASVLFKTDPASFAEARAQLGDALKRAAYGGNLTGDLPFSPVRFQGELRRIGADKLLAFFNPAEVADLQRAARVGAYISQAPNASAVNTSNTAGTVMNLLSYVPVASRVAGVASRVIGALNDQATVRNALAAAVKPTDAPLNAAQQNYLRLLLGMGAAGGGAAAGGTIQ